MRVDGRFQQVRARGRRLLLDVAHNPHAMAALAASYRARYEGNKKCPAALVALKDDKDAAGILPLLADLSDRLLFCPLPDASHHPPEDLARACPGPARAEAVASWEEGLDRLPAAAPAAPPPLVCGSHFLVGAVLRITD